MNNKNIRTLLFGFVALIALALALALSGRSDSDDAGSPDQTTTSTAATTTAGPTSTAAPTTTPTAPPDERALAVIEGLVDGLSDRRVAEQLIVTGLTGNDAPTRLRDVVGTSCVGGVFVTESNTNWSPTDDARAARATIDAIRDTAIRELCAAPPLVMTDAELGSIVRVPVEPPNSTGSYVQRYTSDEPVNVLLALQQDAATYATALKDLGIDVNFGAVADVDTSPDHFMATSGRTFGADGGMVAALSNAVVAGHCDAGIASTLKHFPNQGATAEDPHREVSVAIGGKALWNETGRLPYIDTAAPLVMTGHIFMDIDANRPASLSFTITTGLLRQELGYDGVVITDDLSTMRGAIDVIGNAGERAVTAIRAGADLVLYVDDNDATGVINALADEMASDAVFAELARERAVNILRLKDALGRMPTSDGNDFELC